MKTERSPVQQVGLGQLQDAIRSQWKQYQAETPDGNVTRALTLNLIAITTASKERELRALLEKLPKRLPCRAFFVILDPAEKQIRAEVSGLCNERQGMREIVLEQIDLRVPWHLIGKVSGIVRPLLVNDIPTHLYWATNLPADAHQFDAFAKLADHTIVDSAQFATALELEQLMRRHGEDPHFTDLAWLRVRPWRRALAEAFERFAYAPEKPTVVTIRHDHSMGSLSSAMLLGQWLERKLGATVYLEEGNGQAHGCLEAVDLRHDAVLVHLERIDNGDLRTTVTTAESCFLPFTVQASRGTVGDLLAAAIDRAC